MRVPGVKYVDAHGRGIGATGLIQIPRVFCLDDAPEETLLFLEELARNLRSTPTRNFHISHKKTEKVGLGASYLFDKIVLDAVASWRRLRLPFALGGTISKVKSVNNFLLAFGWFRQIGLDTVGMANVDHDYERRFVSFLRPGSSIDPYDKGLATYELVGYFDSCLKHNGRQLTPQGRRRLLDAIGELICNAEQHAGVTPAHWVALGCYSKELNECRFSILNKGQTITQSLWSEDSTARSALTYIVETQKPEFRDRLMEWIRTRKHESYFNEATWTVFALQEGVSSKRTDEGSGETRGKGFMDVIEFIEQVSDAVRERTVTILSGNAQVKIDYEYPVFWTKLPEGADVRRIAFNEAKDLLAPHDNRKVRILNNFHGGTVISGAFRFRSDYLTNEAK